MGSAEEGCYVLTSYQIEEIDRQEKLLEKLEKSMDEMEKKVHSDKLDSSNINAFKKLSFGDDGDTIHIDDNLGVAKGITFNPLAIDGVNKSSSGTPITAEPIYLHESGGTTLITYGTPNKREKDRYLFRIKGLGTDGMSNEKTNKYEYKYVDDPWSDKRHWGIEWS